MELTLAVCHRCSSLLLVSISLQTRLQPYREPALNKAEEFALSSTMFVLMAGVVFTNNPNGSLALAWAVVVAMASTGIVCAYAAFECGRTYCFLHLPADRPF